MTAADHEDAFQDPLENYDPPEYKDDLERALDELTVGEMDCAPVASIESGITVGEAVKQMDKLDTACLQVVEGDGTLVGIFSYRDVLNHIAEDFEGMKDKPVSEFMTENPRFAFDTDASGAPIYLMAAVGHRHVPVLDANEKALGMICPRCVTTFLLKYLDGP